MNNTRKRIVIVIIIIINNSEGGWFRFFLRREGMGKTIDERYLYPSLIAVIKQQ